MAITNTFPYVTLRTYHNISDEDMERLNYNDIVEIDRRHAINSNPEPNKHVGLGEFLSIEREELINGLSYEQFEKAAMESFEEDKDDRYGLMGLFFQTYFSHLHTKRKHQRWIDEGRYGEKPEEKLLVDRLLAKDGETLLRVGTIDPHDKYPMIPKEQLVRSSNGRFKDKIQWRDLKVSETPNFPKEYPEK